MAFIILLQTLDKNCGNFKCPDKLDFIYSHAKIKIKIKKRWLQKVHYILYKFIILKYRQYKKKINNNNLRPSSTVSYLVAHYEVPELGGLGYFVKYPSPPSSGTIWINCFSKNIQIGTRAWSGTRAHQARVPIWIYSCVPIHFQRIS